MNKEVSTLNDVHSSIFPIKIEMCRLFQFYKTTWASSRNFIRSLTGTFRAWAFNRKFRSSVMSTTSRCNRIAPSKSNKSCQWNITPSNSTFVLWKELSWIVMTLKHSSDQNQKTTLECSAHTYFKQHPKMVSSFDS